MVAGLRISGSENQRHLWPTRGYQNCQLHTIYGTRQLNIAEQKGDLTTTLQYPKRIIRGTCLNHLKAGID